MRKLPRVAGWVLNREELAWAAGFADGEGSFHTRKRQSKKSTTHHPTITISQVDTQVLERFRLALGMGQVSNPVPPRGPISRRPIYHYRLASFEKYQAAVALLWTWLSPVKREQAASVLQRFHESRLLKESVR